MTDGTRHGAPHERTGPLAGFRVVELAGIGPCPFAAMLLADMGAEVVQVERIGGGGIAVPPAQDLLRRGRASVALDLRDPRGAEAVLQLVERADALVEGFRPGVAERLGVGPDACLERNPRLVYGRMTGWGQDGPLARTAGHDLDYVAVTGALHAMGRRGEAPAVPLNLVGDFGGGALYLATGVLAALLETGRSGVGQVVDAAIVDGTASLSTMQHGLLAAGLWRDRRGENLLDTGVPWYDVYATSDGGHVAVGALEPQFFAALVDVLGLDYDPADRDRPDTWPRLRELLTAAFVTRTRDAWADVFAATDACVAPVVSLTEAPDHPHLAARGTFVEVDGVRQPAPAPRFGRTPSAVAHGPVPTGADTRATLEAWGVADVDALIADGVADQV